MPTKGGLKARVPAIHPYELQRLRTCMRNNATLQKLGLPGYSSIFETKTTTATNKKRPKHKNCEGSESDYDLEQDDSGEEDLFAENADKDSRNTSKKNTNMGVADMPPGGFKPRSSKRAIGKQPSTRVTRSKKRHTDQDEAIISNLDVEQPLSAVEGDVPHQLADRTHISSESDAFAEVEHNQTTNINGNGSVETDLGNLIAQAHEHNQMTNDEGNDNLAAQYDEETQLGSNSEGEARCNRGINMGKGLQKLTRARCGKLPLVIPEGKIRPLVPLVAAKFATECNIAVRNHIPIFKHWKDYKRQPGLFEQFLGKLCTKFDMDKSADSVRKACSQMMKSAVRQQRYRLKKKYFDPIPLHLVRKTSPLRSMTDEQWNDLVEFWKNPIKMAICEKNKDNRDKVKFHQMTGSRSYMVHCENLGDKYNNEDPNALDLFKEFHYSKKKGYTPSVQSAITEMENKIAETTDDVEPSSMTDVVADVLAQHTKINKFLQNVGIQHVQRRSSVQNLEAELVTAKRANADLQLLVTTQRDQIDVLSVQVQEAEQARMRDKEEMQKKQAETDAKLQLLLSHMRQSERVR